MTSNLKFNPCYEPYKRNDESCADEFFIVEEAWWKTDLIFKIVKDPLKGNFIIYGNSKFWPLKAFIIQQNGLHSIEACRTKVTLMVRQFEAWLRKHSSPQVQPKLNCKGAAMTAKKTKARSLSPTSKKLVEAFGEAAQVHGWEADQGSPHSAAEAKTSYEESRDALIKRILKLEATVAQYRAQEEADHKANTERVF